MAKLKISFEGDLPEALEGYAVAAEEGEGYELDLDKLVDAGRLGEFRNNNITLTNKNKALADDLKAAQQKVEALEEQLQDKIQTGDTAAKTLQQRIEALEKANKAKDDALAIERQRADQQRIRTDLGEALTQAGVRAKALPDALEVATKGWKVDESGLKLYKGEELVFSSDSAGEPMAPPEFAAAFLKERPHFLAESSGDGGTPGELKRVNGRVKASSADATEWGRVSDLVSQGKLKWEDVEDTAA